MRKTQISFLKEILGVATSNPEMDIIFCVGSEGIRDETWTTHRVSKIEILPWLVDYGILYVGEEEIKRYLYDCYDGELGPQADSYVETEYNNEIAYKICVFTTATSEIKA